MIPCFRGTLAGLLLSAGILVAAGSLSAQTRTPEPRAAAAPASPSARLAELRKEERGLHPPSAESAAARLESIALDFLRVRESARAIEVLSEAAELRPQSGRILARLTLAYLDNGDFEFARAAIDAASGRADLEPEAGALWSEAADRFAAGNRLEDAIAAWELLERSGEAGASVATRIERARRELAVTPGQRLLQGERFAIYSDSAVSESVVTAIEAHLEREYERQRVFFGGGELPGPQIVVLYAGRRFFSLVSVPDWVSGVFDGKIRISIEASSGFTTEVAFVLSHELAHAWIRHLSNDRALGWLHEGLAQWCEGRRVPRRDLKISFSSRPVFSLDELESNLDQRSDREIARVNYVEALGVVEFLASARGEGALACLVRQIGAGETLEAALRRETGLSGAEVLARWKVWAGF